MSLTLVSVGNIQHSLLKFAVEKTVQNVPVDEIKIFSDIDLRIKNSKHIQISSKFNRDDYSIFMMKELVNHIDTDHVLVVQYDGFATHGEFWDEKFLKYDYCGTTTYYKHPPLYNSISDTLKSNVKDKWVSLGGGFSLRSKKMLKAISDDRIDPFIYDDNGGKFLCEDISFGIVYKNILEEEFGIKFCSIEDSIEFGAEILTGYPFCLGFHGWEQIPHFLPESECVYYLDELIKDSGVKNINLSRLSTLIGNSYSCGYNNLLNYIRNTPYFNHLFFPQ